MKDEHVETCVVSDDIGKMFKIRRPAYRPGAAGGRSYSLVLIHFTHPPWSSASVTLSTPPFPLADHTLIVQHIHTAFYEITLSMYMHGGSVGFTPHVEIIPFVLIDSIIWTLSISIECEYKLLLEGIECICTHYFPFLIFHCSPKISKNEFLAKKCVLLCSLIDAVRCVIYRSQL
ncbi:hypothetical protein DINM_004347 [Dirofilaria immitis]|nr:hypothetical protein [Dirofilaria immitis]